MSESIFSEQSCELVIECADRRSTDHAPSSSHESAELFERLLSARREVGGRAQKEQESERRRSARTRTVAFHGSDCTPISTRADVIAAVRLDASVSACSDPAAVRVLVTTLVALFAGADPAAKPTGAGHDRVQPDSRPVEIESSSGFSMDMKNHTGFAKGDVVIKREDVLVCCDEADAKFASDSSIERVTCRGRVVIVKPDGTRATAHLAVFVASEDKVTLTGDAHVHREDTDLTGEQIIYDIGHDHLEVGGSRSRFQRVKPGTPAPKEASSRPCPPTPAKKKSG
jgi:lipopolysaccharide transport protein LptA